MDSPQPTSEAPAGFPPRGDVLRSVRQIRGISQRELATQSAVARATIERIESGRSRDPGVGTLDRILRGAQFRLAVLTESGRELQVRPGRFRLYDAAGRHLPGHLPARRLRSTLDPWWGWFRIGWDISDRVVPDYTFDRRRPPLDEYWLALARWQDAT
jgi:transcriptional regulator with XRE-family HTH domain